MGDITSHAHGTSMRTPDIPCPDTSDCACRIPSPVTCGSPQTHVVVLPHIHRTWRCDRIEDAEKTMQQTS